MVASSIQRMERTESLRFFVRTRRAIAWLATLSGLLAFLALFRSPTTALVPAFFLVLLYGIWLFLVLLERREAFRLEDEPRLVARREIAAERAELRTAIGIGLAILVVSALAVAVLLGLKWLGTVALLLFLYLLVIGGPYWLAQVLARGEDARRRPR